MTLDDATLTRLTELAQAATPGERTYSYNPAGVSVCNHEYIELAYCKATKHLPVEQAIRDAAYIAAVSPDVVLALVKWVRDAEDRYEREDDAHAETVQELYAAEARAVAAEARVDAAEAAMALVSEAREEFRVRVAELEAGSVSLNRIIDKRDREIVRLRAGVRAVTEEWTGPAKLTDELRALLGEQPNI